MKFSFLFILISIFCNIFCNHFRQKINKIQTQCKGLVEILANTTTKNPGIQEGSVKIELSYYKTSLDMNCILGGLQHVNKNITISSISESKIIIPKVNPDYLIYFEDYLQDVSYKIENKFILIHY